MLCKRIKLYLKVSLQALILFLQDLIDAISNKPEFVNGKQVGVLKPPLQDAVSKFDGTLNLFVIEHLMRRGLWYEYD